MVLLFTVFTPVDLFIRIRQYKYMLKPLLDRRDTSWILAADDVRDLLWQMKPRLIYDPGILDDIDRDIMVDESEHIQINKINRAFDLHDVFLAHLIASRVFDDGDAAV